jgi:hypothetical protein
MTTPRTGTRRPLAILVGGGVVLALYLSGAMVSGQLSPLDRRPLLDGFASAPPYRWVSPPPGFVSGNEPPSSGSVTLKLGTNGSVGGVVSTQDLQVTVIFKDGAFHSKAGATGVDVVVEPLDPATLGALPTGLTVVGNAYRVRADVAGASGPAPALGATADLSIVYPALAHAGITPPEHVILASSDGSAWHRIPTSDASGVLTAAATIDALGDFVVGEPTSAIAPARAPATRSYLPFIVGGIGLLLLLLSSPRIVSHLRRRVGREEASWRR